jgi:hypothetical protein
LGGVEELADVREVMVALMAALMAARGITDQEVAKAAAAKLEQRGAFDSGVRLVA